MHSLITFVVANRLFAVVFALAILLLAWARLPYLEIAQYPNIEVPMLTINVTLPGASSVEMERRVVNKMEDTLERVRHLKKVTSRITNSYAQIVIEYERGIAIDNEYTVIYAMLNNLKPELPADVEMVVLKQNPTDRIVSFILGISSPLLDREERSKLAEELKKRLRTVKGIENLTIMKPDEEIRITLDPARMGRYGVGFDQVLQSLQQNNLFLPTGKLTLTDKTFSLMSQSGGFNGVADIASEKIISNNGSAIALSELATVEKVIKDNAILTRVGNDQAQWVTMKLNKSANVFTVKAQLQAITAKFQAEVGDQVQVSWLFDVEEGVSAKLGQLLSNILSGIAILAVVLLLAVGYRSALIITLMLPVALFLSIVGLSLTDYGIQEISLAGFIISLGLIVDSGIVVTENAFKLETYSGYEREQAAITGTASVMVPLISSTLTTALAFAPIFFLDSITGLLLHSLAATIWLCLAASLVAAMVFAALLLARMGTNSRVSWLPNIPSFMNGLKPTRDIAYVACLRYFIRKPWLLFVSVLSAVAVSLWLAAGLDVIIFPDSEEPYFTVTINADKDRSTAFMTELSAEILTIVSQNEDVEQCSSITGATFPGVHTGIRWLPSASNVGTVFCKVNFRNREKLNALTNKIDARLSGVTAAAKLETSAFINGDGVDSYDVEVRLQGESISAIRTQANEIEAYLRVANIDGIAFYNNPAQPNWFALNIVYRENAANALGVSKTNINQALVMLTHGYEAGEFIGVEGQALPIMLKLDSNITDPLSVFDRVFVSSDRGEQIPLSALVDLVYAEDEFDIYHKQFGPELAIGINGKPGYPVDRLTADIQQTLADYPLKPDLTLAYGGKLAAADDAFGSAGRYVGIIGLVILGIFVLQFKSFVQPLIVLAAIPLSFIGAFILLWVTGLPLSFIAFIGLTALMGIVINNSILLIDEGNTLFQSNAAQTAAEVAISAGVNRFMPIVLTSLTSVCGLLPLAVGDSMFQPLAVVVIGGLTTSAILTLICVPVLYALLTRPKRPLRV
jgi:multidrug efflux pump subunit AcrB